MKAKSTALARQRETKCHEERERERERGKTQALNYPLPFYRNSNRACSLVSSAKLHVWCETSFRSPPQNGDRNFRLSSLHPVWCPTDCLYLVASGYQIPLFLFSIPAQSDGNVEHTDIPTSVLICH